jgi:hypothetical protein
MHVDICVKFSIFKLETAKLPPVLVEYKKDPLLELLPTFLEDGFVHVNVVGGSKSDKKSDNMLATIVSRVFRVATAGLLTFDDLKFMHAALDDAWVRSPPSLKQLHRFVAAATIFRFVGSLSFASSGTLRTLEDDLASDMKLAITWSDVAVPWMTDVAWVMSVTLSTLLWMVDQGGSVVQDDGAEFVPGGVDGATKLLHYLARKEYSRKYPKKEEDDSMILCRSPFVGVCVATETRPKCFWRFVGM